MAKEKCLRPEKPSKKYQKNYTAAPVDDDKEGELKKPKKRTATKESKHKIVDLLKAVDDETDEEKKPRLRTWLQRLQKLRMSTRSKNL